MLMTFAEPDVRRKIALLSGTSIPGQRQPLVLGNAFAPSIGMADLDPGPGVTTTGRRAPPAQCFVEIAPGHADALRVTLAQFELGIATAFLRGAASTRPCQLPDCG